MRKLIFAALGIFAVTGFYACSDDDNNTEKPIDPDEQARLDSIRYADSMNNVKEISLPILEYGIGIDELIAKEQRTLLYDTTWTIQGELGDNEFSMTRRELDYGETRPNAISFQVMYLFGDSKMTDGYMAVWRDRGKELYEFMNWGFKRMGSSGGKDYYLSKDSTDFIYIRDMYTINPEYDYYFINFQETSPEEIKYFYGRPAAGPSALSSKILKADRQMMMQAAFRIRK